MENKKINTLLIDGYLDEPSCLGVPPYISPHIRYTYGALLLSGIKENNLKYRTIDQLRENWEENLNWMENFDLLIIIAGTTVPGHYLGGKPISLAEIKEIGKEIYYPQKILGGPITLVKKKISGYDYICREIAALDISQILNNKKIENNPHKISNLINKWAIHGAKVTELHPNYPYLVCEIETFRGCPRCKHCAFCSERLKNKTYQRKPEQIIAEIKSLATSGNHYYRLGCQTDLLMYQAQSTSGGLKPSSEAIERLYSGIREADPDLKVLHLDNMNPANIIRYRKESKKILQTITRLNTPGDTAAFGLESADPLVLKKNNIDTDPETTIKAIKMINKIGGKRIKGVPVFLPGINFLHGLIGERNETLQYNYQFLKKILDMGLMLRRINIRQVVTLDNYPQISIDKGKFDNYKDKINKEINKPMLKRVFPTGTILKNILIEKHHGRLTYGRQLGTYPILVGIPGKFELNKFMTVRVIDHGYRSLTALPWPFNINKASIDQLTYIPGIGRKKANRIFINQPENKKELHKLLGKNFPFSRWKDWFELS